MYCSSVTTATAIINGNDAHAAFTSAAPKARARTVRATSDTPAAATAIRAMNELTSTQIPNTMPAAANTPGSACRRRRATMASPMNASAYASAWCG